MSLLNVFVFLAVLAVGFAAMRLSRRPPRVRRVEPASIGATGPAIVQFGTSHSARCKRGRPILEQAARDGGLEFVDIDLHARPDLASRYGIRSVPVIIVTAADGEVLGRWTAVPPDHELARAAEIARAT